MTDSKWLRFRQHGKEENLANNQDGKPQMQVNILFVNFSSHTPWKLFGVCFYTFKQVLPPQSRGVTVEMLK
jgi:hypothetical protein